MVGHLLKCTGIEGQKGGSSEPPRTPLPPLPTGLSWNFICIQITSAYLDLAYLNQQLHVSVSRKSWKVYKLYCNITNGLGRVTCDSNQPFLHGVGYDKSAWWKTSPLPLWLLCFHAAVFSLNNTDLQCAQKKVRPLLWSLQGRLQSNIWYLVSVQSLYQHIYSCLCHPVCSDGSSTGLLPVCLQTDSGNRNSQWASVHIWSQSQHLSTSGMNWCFIHLRCMHG